MEQNKKKNNYILSHDASIKVAHLHPNNPNMVHEPQVLKMCYADMKERSILPGEITLE
jgi:hypothetical protein